MATILNDTVIQLLQQEGVPTSQVQSHPLPEGASFYTVPVSRTVALRTWQRLRERVEQTGFWPLLTEASDEWLQMEQGDGSAAAAVIAASREIDPPAWIAQQKAAHIAWLMEEGYALEEDEGGAQEGDWPDDVAPSDGFYTLQQAPALWLCLVPTTIPWTVPAYLPFGGWNECPHDEVHVAFLRRWYEQYGAELVVMTRDILEFTVARPPQTREQALTLAWEQYGYCADIVDQGTETISNLAASLLNSTVWFFWWD